MQNIKVAVDAVVFGYKDEQLFLLCIKQKFGPLKGHWVLPGGLVKDKERLQEAVIRELLEETNVEVEYLEQLYTFGDTLDRDPRGRVITVTYLGLVNPEGLKIKAATDAMDAKWFSVEKLPSLGFDHNEIVAKGLERLRSKVHYEPIGFDLLNPIFYMAELEGLYRTLTRRDFDRRNFRRKILRLGLLEDLGIFSSPGKGRPANKYRFIEQRFKELQEEGFQFEIKFS
ncbi:NUDIX hydrolase [Robertkochia sediminum]|uniref:NUDIX hydrolase n=1 Tax=Robertkochia sediminum TaxID=2785326 RepID=UPI00193223E9|nr:NUDIX domain-containing protein [Robertkochia sediminum]MBL7473300.1 NUDIX hydrolase [Robertkochia sediminum]